MCISYSYSPIRAIKNIFWAVCVIHKLNKKDRFKNQNTTFKFSFLTKAGCMDEFYFPNIPNKIQFLISVNPFVDHFKAIFLHEVGHCVSRSRRSRHVLDRLYDEMIASLYASRILKSEIISFFLIAALNTYMQNLFNGNTTGTLEAKIRVVNIFTKRIHAKQVKMV